MEFLFKNWQFLFGTATLLVAGGAAWSSLNNSVVNSQLIQQQSIEIIQTRQEAQNDRINSKIDSLFEKIEMQLDYHTKEIESLGLELKSLKAK